MIKVEINGKEYEVEPGRPLIDVADENDIDIPRFCYHKKLSAPANCRMCLVEVEGSRKPLPACITEVADGMKVNTRSPEAIDAQKSVMEFMLINHPLDCPICDQGGQCELQDVAMGYGSDVSRYNQGKRVVKDEDLGPLVATDMTRCIHCTRCVRFGEEVAGVRDLGATGRGENTRIGTFVGKALSSELSGNIIDVCPVGALTSKPFRYQARSWEMTQKPSVAPHDCLGSNTYYHTLRGQVKRVAPRENDAVNEVWLSDRDRFSYLGLASEDRLYTPRIKREGKWHVTDWQTALDAAMEGLTSVLSQHGGAELGVLASPNSTVEELYLLQKLARGLGTQNIDHRTHQQDFSDEAAFPAYPGLPVALDAIAEQDTILLVGCNVRDEAPLLTARLRKALERGAKILSISAQAYGYRFDVAQQVITAPHTFAQAMASVAEQVGVQTSGGDSADTAELAAHLKGDSGKVLVIFGEGASIHPHASQLRAYAYAIAKQCGGQFGVLTQGANSAGAWMTGMTPHRGVGGEAVSKPGLNAKTMFESKLKAYLLLGVEPEFDCVDSAAALAALKEAQTVVAMTPFLTPALAEYATVILPIAPHSETEGTFVNACGEWQHFDAAVKCDSELRPGWKVLRVLGNACRQTGFEYETAAEICEEAKAKASDSAGDWSLSVPNSAAPAVSGVMRLGEWPSFRADALVRRAGSLQETPSHRHLEKVRMNQKTADAYHIAKNGLVAVQQGAHEVSLALQIDNTLPDNTVIVPSGTKAAVGLGLAAGDVTLRGNGAAV